MLFYLFDLIALKAYFKVGYVAVLCFSLVLETKAAPNRFAAISRLSVSRRRPRGTRQKSTLSAGGRTLFLARARNKSCAEPLRRSMATQRFSHTATRYKTKKHPVCRWPYFVSRSRSKQKLRRTTSPLYGGSAFLAYGHAACKKTDPVCRCPYFVSRSRSKQKLRRTASPLYGDSAFLAGGHAAQDKKAPCWVLFCLVPVAGLEPARYRYRWILSPLRLPIPSHRRVMLFYNTIYQFVWQAF